MFADVPKPVRRTFGKRRRPVKTPEQRLADAIIALGEGMGRIVIHTETPWASITFAGTRNRLRMTFEGPDAVAAGERLIAALPDHEFAIPGQLVADAQIVSADHAMFPEPVLRIDAEVLMLDES